MWSRGGWSGPQEKGYALSVVAWAVKRWPTSGSPRSDRGAPSLERAAGPTPSGTGTSALEVWFIVLGFATSTKQRKSQINRRNLCKPGCQEGQLGSVTQSKSSWELPRSPSEPV